MKKLILLVSVLFSLYACRQSEQKIQTVRTKEIDPVAKADAVVISGNARFTVLTPGLIRLEWDSLGKFEDHASLTFITRNLPVPKFSKTENGGFLQIATEKLTLKYKTGSGKFSPENLEIIYHDKTPVSWKPGTPNNGNLKGTTRTLDGCNGGTNWVGDTITLENGIISRDGWYLADDSKNFLFDTTDWNWVMPRPEGNRQDWYFFGYGKDYKGALYDFTRVAGKIPIPPKYAFGYWWSRYWSYTDEELRELVADMDRFDLPLDVMVIDMDWHITDNLSWKKPITDEFGQSVGWTGFTWNKNLFPDPDKFIQWTNDKNISTTMNLHPASGVAPWEIQYAAFAKAMNIDTTGHKNIPFEIADKKFAENYFNILLHPMQEKGIDFWWLDWQQWPFSKKYPGLSNTFWLNYCHFTDMQREGKVRPMLYHRWGGLGNHRYQIGFSGDAIITWKSLAYQPYFTTTASNVGYGYWSHDIGGHMWGNLPKEQQVMNPELTTRWTQFGVFSPILRHHSTKNPSIYKEAWLYPNENFKAMHDAINLRYALFPYIYTNAREAYETGISIVRPMYYEYPEMEEAYTYHNQYMFGDDMIVAPVINHAPEGDNQAIVKVWLPKGQWYEWYTGTTLEGGKVYDRKFLINEIPVYVKAGAIIPMYPKIKNLKETVDELVLTVFPGENSETKVYEDQGNNDLYRQNEFSYTTITKLKGNDGSITLTVNPREGSFQGMSADRSYHIRLVGSMVPESVTVDGKIYDYAANETCCTWTYSGNDLTTHIIIPKTPCSSHLTVTVKYTADAVNNASLLNGKIGQFSRYRIAGRYIKVAWGFVDAGPLPAIVTKTEQTATRIQYNPQNLIEELKNFDIGYAEAPVAVNSLPFDQTVKDQFEKYLK